VAGAHDGELPALHSDARSNQSGNTALKRARCGPGEQDRANADGANRVAAKRGNGEMSNRVRKPLACALACTRRTSRGGERSRIVLNVRTFSRRGRQDERLAVARTARVQCVDENFEPVVRAVVDLAAHPLLRTALAKRDAEAMIDVGPHVKRALSRVTVCRAAKHVAQTRIWMKVSNPL